MTEFDLTDDDLGPSDEEYGRREVAARRKALAELEGVADDANGILELEACDLVYLLEQVVQSVTIDDNPKRAIECLDGALAAATKTLAAIVKIRAEMAK